MSDLVSKFSRVMESALAQTCAYVETEFGIETNSQPPRAGDVETLELRKMTAIIGVGGVIDLFVAFSFEDSLIQALYMRMTEGMGITPEEEEEYRKATAGEMVNIVMGHCATDLQDMDTEVIPITPPTVLNLVKVVPRLKNAVFHLRSISTPFGAMDVYLIGPKELFSDSLDYIN